MKTSIENSTLQSDTPHSAMRMLEDALDRITTAPDAETDRALSEFCEAVAAAEGLPPSTLGNDPLCDLARYAQNSKNSFIAACLVRLASRRPTLIADGKHRFELLKLFDAVYAGSVYRMLKIDVKTLNHEKLEVLGDELREAEVSLRRLSRELSSLATVSDFRNDFQKKLNSEFSKCLVLPFLPKDLARSRMAEIFLHITDYLEAAGQEKAPAYQRAAHELRRYSLEALEHGSLYSKDYLVGIADTLLRCLDADFSLDPASKPGKLRFLKTEKKYPLHEIGKEFSITLVVANEGPGQAFDVECVVNEITGVEPMRSTTYVGDLPPSNLLVDIPVRVVDEVGDILANVSACWKNFDGTVGQSDEWIELSGQRPDIDWEKLEIADPYYLEPVETEEELVGRREVLDKLLASARARTTGSSYLYGQKRVGKTSIVKTFRRRLSATHPEFRTIYLESGDYVHQDPLTTIDNLGVRLCKDVVHSDSRLSRLQTPRFSGALSPLVDFLADVRQIAPDLSFTFILDEFDELPIELYRRTPVGDAFFVTLRSISGKEGLAFILVGGEKMRAVVEYQGDRLNKFQPIRLDYFDKAQHWSDFQDLVRRPVGNWLEISEQALGRIYEQAAGNPYFTRLVCREIVGQTVRNRDGHVTETEVQKSVRQAVRTAEGNSFQHFWQDGILEAPDRAEQVSMNRRRVLIVLAELIRKGVAPTMAELVEGCRPLDLAEGDTEQLLRSFVERGVLIPDEDRYAFKVPLFKSWMIERGIREVITTFSDPELALRRRQQEEEARVRAEEIVAICGRWGPYRGQSVAEERVRAWLEQFGDNAAQRLMFKILTGLKFYSTNKLRAKMRDAHGIVTRGLVRRMEEGKMKRNDIFVSYLDGPAKSGSYYAKAYADENGIYVTNVIEKSTICSTVRAAQAAQALVFIDDFLGTGQSAYEYFVQLHDECGPELVASGIPIFLVAVTGFADAKANLDKKLNELGLPVVTHICDPMTDADKLFSPTSSVFPNAAEREQAQDIAHRIGLKLEKKAPLGFGNCQAAVVFDSSCPNNNLPVLWKDSTDWIALFKRV